MNKDKTFEVVKDNGVLKLHTYVAHLSTGDKTIALPYGKTSLITAILFGSVTDFREIIKEYIQPDSISINIADMKMKVIIKALEILNKDFSVKIVNQLTEIMDIMLTEYDEDGKVKIKGRSFNLAPEDVKVLIDILMHDIPEVLKNVFGVGAIKKSVSPTKKIKEEKLENQNQEKEDGKTELL